MATTVFCFSCETLAATRELEYETVNDDFEPEHNGIPVCASQHCFDEAMAEITREIPGAEYRQEIAYHVPAPREIPEAERTEKSSPAWFGKHQSDPAVAPRQELVERHQFDAKGFPTGRMETITNLYATCTDCGHEYRLTATGSSREMCPVNAPAYEARMVEYRRRLLAA